MHLRPAECQPRLLQRDNSGDEAERFCNGNCIRCALRDDLTATLQPNTPLDPRPTRLVIVFADAERPERIYTRKRGIGAGTLLTRLGTRELAIHRPSLVSLIPSRNEVPFPGRMKPYVLSAELA